MPNSTASAWMRSFFCSCETISGSRRRAAVSSISRTVCVPMPEGSWST